MEGGGGGKEGGREIRGMAYDNTLPREMRRDLLADKCQNWLWSELGSSC